MNKALAAAVGVILATEGGVPVPVPSDLVLLGLGERAGAGVFPLWAVMASLEVVVVIGTCVLFLLARRLGHRLVERLSSGRERMRGRIDRVRGIVDSRGNVGLVAGRATPGLRTITVLVAGLSTAPAWLAVLLLVIGSSIFVQGHVLLGYVIGPAAREAIDQLPVATVGVLGVVAIVGLGVWLARRGRSGGVRGWIEGSCPACLAVGLSDRNDVPPPST